MSTQKATEAQEDLEAGLLEPSAGRDDLLIIGYHNETPPRDVDLHFPLRWVVPVASALCRLEGWRGKRVYYTDNAMRVGTVSEWQAIEFWSRWAGGELLHANHFSTVKEPNA